MTRHLIMNATITFVALGLLYMITHPYPASESKTEIGVPVGVDKFDDPISGVTCYTTRNYKNISCVKTKG